MRSITFKRIFRYAMLDLRNLATVAKAWLSKPFDITYTDGENIAKFRGTFNRLYAEKQV